MYPFICWIKVSPFSKLHSSADPTGWFYIFPQLSCLTSINESFFNQIILLTTLLPNNMDPSPSHWTNCLSEMCIPPLLVQASPPQACLDFSMPQGLLSPLDSLGTCCVHIACIVYNSHLARHLDQLGFYFFFICFSFFWKLYRSIFKTVKCNTFVCVSVYELKNLYVKRA